MTTREAQPARPARAADHEEHGGQGGRLLCLDRTRGVGQALITHTLSDKLALAHEEGRQERPVSPSGPGYVVLGALRARKSRCSPRLSRFTVSKPPPHRLVGA